MSDITNKFEEQLKKQDELVRKMAEPSPLIKKLAEPSPAMQALAQHAANMRVLTQRMSPVIAQGVLVPFGNILSTVSVPQAQLFSTSAVSFLNNYSSVLRASFNSPIMNWLKDGVVSPVASILATFDALMPPDFNIEQFDELYLDAMYNARWFPYTRADVDLIMAILDVLEETKGAKTRQKRIGEEIFKYYTKTKIEKIRKSWRTLELPAFKIKILNQAVNAYHRKEYALTVSALITLWEGIIAQKVNEPDDYRVSGKTRQNMAKLIDGADGDDKIKSFCDEFIFYDCKKQEEVKEDVPGRHGVAHSWYEKYPSKKMALNAIIFTDFLLNAQPLPTSQ